MIKVRPNLHSFALGCIAVTMWYAGAAQQNGGAYILSFLTMAIANGMTSAITSPLHPEVRQAVMAADVLMGTDENCAAWIARFREQPADGATSGRRGGREGRRRGAGAAPS